MDETALKSLKLAKVFGPDDDEATLTGRAAASSAEFGSDRLISSFDISADGTMVVAAFPGIDTLRCYDAQGGKPRKTILSKKYGVDLVRFTHKSTNVIYTGPNDGVIRYLSLHDNAYLRYFSGHRGRVTSVELCPVSDAFLSAGEGGDGIRVWDLRSASGQAEGILAVPGSPLIAFDPQGLIFAVATESRHIRLYDLANYGAGPFAVFEIVDQEHPQSQWTGLAFSPDGRDLLLDTDLGHFYLVDAFEGNVKHVCRSKNASSAVKRSPRAAAWTPDGSHIVRCQAGSELLTLWRPSDGQLVAQLSGHTRPPQSIMFNPRYAMMVSSCANLAFWLPDQ